MKAETQLETNLDSQLAALYNRSLNINLLISCVGEEKGGGEEFGCFQDLFFLNLLPQVKWWLLSDVYSVVQQDL